MGRVKAAIASIVRFGKVSINLRGREWVNPQGEAKYFNSLQGWRIEGVTVESKKDDEDVPF